MTEQIRRTEKEQISLLKTLLETDEMRGEMGNILVCKTKGLFCWEGNQEIYYPQKGVDLNSIDDSDFGWEGNTKIYRGRDVCYLEDETVLFGNFRSESGYGFYRYYFHYNEPVSLEEAIAESLFDVNDVIETFAKRIEYKRMTLTLAGKIEYMKTGRKGIRALRGYSSTSEFLDKLEKNGEKK